LSAEEGAFREQLLAWLAAHPPTPAAGASQDEVFEQRRSWQRSLAEGGWAAVTWPEEFGGRAATATQSAIFFEELARSGAPLPGNVLGLLLAGPTIMTHGTVEQRERFLGPIVTADEIWCQGFSEPDAGSDLASLRTKAVLAGDRWVINGQKVWTSYARYADWCMLLARTDPNSTRHKGLTYFLLDMHQPGVAVRPLRDITGAAHFNEVFLDDAIVETGQVLGDVGDGWTVAMTTLMNERAGLSLFHQTRLQQMLDRLVNEAREAGALGTPMIDASLAEVHARIQALRLTTYRGLGHLDRTGSPGPESSVVKILWATINQQLTQLAVDILGDRELASDSFWSYELLRSRGNSIEGGTTEILRNIVAERVLALPRVR
jgi:alkylation response protein AidB-like acyl-CoA dehydrogenase